MDNCNNLFVFYWLILSFQFFKKSIYFFKASKKLKLNKKKLNFAKQGILFPMRNLNENHNYFNEMNFKFENKK